MLMPQNVDAEKEKGKEKKVNLKEIKVFRVRHGNSEYKEIQENTLELADDELDLTEKGIKELEQTAEHLASTLNPETDVIVIASSERRRAVSSAAIIKNKLVDSGFTIWNDPVAEKGRKTRTVTGRLNDMEIMEQKSGKIIPPLSKDYWDASGDVWQEYIKEESTISPKDVYPMWRDGKIERLSGDTYTSDSIQDINLRSANHLALLMRIAKKFQPRLSADGKRLVIIEAEHGESLNDFASKAKVEKAVSHGGYMELAVPIDSDEINVKTWDINDGEKSAETVHFDAQKRKFI